MPEPVERLRVLLLSTLACVLVGACSSTPPNLDGSEPERSPADPWEPLNRTIFSGNRGIDRFTLRPLAKGYGIVVPRFIRLGVNNFSRNLRSPLHIINHFLQGKFVSGFRQTGRFLMNTTFGIVGLMDVATDAGIDVEVEDFGQTLAVWGVPDGPFVVVPLLGPRTLRDAIVIPFNFLADPLLHYDNSSVRDKIYLIRTIDFRHQVLSLEELLEDAYDPYIRMREAYLQRRRYLIHDGNPPEDEDLYEEFDEEFFEDE